MPGQVAHVERQDRRNGAGSDLNNHGGDKQADDQARIFKGGKDLAGMQHLFFRHRGKIFPDAE